MDRLNLPSLWGRIAPSTRTRIASGKLDCSRFFGSSVSALPKTCGRHATRLASLAWRYGSRDVLTRSPVRLGLGEEHGNVHQQTGEILPSRHNLNPVAFQRLVAVRMTH